MRQLHCVTRLLAGGILLAGLSVGLFAQDKPDQNQRDRAKSETTLTGCLNKDSGGTYTLTDEKTGTKSTVAGSPDLEKHSANHLVTLTGENKTDASGKTVFEVSKIQHMSTSCTPAK